VIQEGADVVLVEPAGMGGVVEADEAGDPSGVRFFGVIAVLAAPADLPHLIEELGRFGFGAGHGEGKGWPSVVCGLKIRSLMLNISSG